MWTSRHIVLPAVLLVVALRCYTTQAYSYRYHQRRPNIVFILADDLGWNDVGYHNPDIISPNLDRLANNGVILNQSYVQPVCTPTRGALMTGVYPFRLGLQHLVILPQQAVCLPLDRITLPQVFKQNGYATHMVGKWHLGFCNQECTPTYRGFDSFYGFYNALQDYYTKEVGGFYDFRDNEDVDYSANGTYSAFLNARRIKSIIKNHDKEQPLFLYLAFPHVHSPLQVPRRYYNMYTHIQDEDRRIFSGMVTAMDDVIGQTVKALRKKKIFDNTLFVFSSDNGGIHTLGGNNYPLRGAKTTVFEGGTRAVGFISGSMVPKAGVYNGLIHVVDWFPTLAEAAGLKYYDHDQDGVNQWQSLISMSEPSQRHELVYNLDQSPDPLTGRAAIRVGDYKLIEGYPGAFPEHYKPEEVLELTPAQQTSTSLQNDEPGNFTLLVQDATKGNRDPANRFLFNLKDDPYEYVNLYDEEPEIVAQLQDRLARHWARAVEPNFPPPSPESDPANYDGVWSPGWC